MCRSLEECISRHVNPTVTPIPKARLSHCAERAAGITSMNDDSPHKTEISASVQCIQDSVQKILKSGKINELFRSKGVTMDMIDQLSHIYPGKEDEAFVEHFYDNTANRFGGEFWDSKEHRENLCPDFETIGHMIAREGMVIKSFPRFACDLCKMAARNDIMQWPHVSDDISETCWGIERNRDGIEDQLQIRYQTDEMMFPTHQKSVNEIEKLLKYYHAAQTTIVQDTLECYEEMLASKEKSRTLRDEEKSRLLHSAWMQSSFVYFQTILDYQKLDHQSMICKYVAFEVRKSMVGFFGSPGIQMILKPATVSEGGMFSSRKVLQDPLPKHVEEKYEFRISRLCRDIRCCPSIGNFISPQRGEKFFRDLDFDRGVMRRRGGRGASELEEDEEESGVRDLRGASEVSGGRRVSELEEDEEESGGRDLRGASEVEKVLAPHPKPNLDK